MSTDEAVAADTDGGAADYPETAPEPRPGGGRSPGSRRRRALQWVVPALVLALLDAGGLVWWHHRDSTPAVAAVAGTTRTLAVSPATLKENITATGTLTPTIDDTFGFSVSGVVNHVYVEAGQTVKAGQVLAIVGTTALAASLAQAKATVAADRATLAADTADSASSTQIAADNATITEAAAAVATAAANLADATLRAPVAGEITTFGLAVGDTVTGSSSGSGGGSSAAAGGAASGGVSSGTGSSGSAASTGSDGSSSSSEVEIVGTSSWEVATTVDDTDIGELAVGDEATITLSLSSSSGSTTTTGGGGFGGFGGGTGGFANGGATGTGGTTTGTGATGSGTASTPATTTVYGTVTSIGLVPSTTTGVAAYPVVVTVTGTSPDLFSGMGATAAITYRQLTNVLAVPTTAIATSGSAHTVEVSANGKTTKTTVQTGAVVGTETQIVSGLSSGQEIVLPAVRGATGTTGTGRFGGAGTGGFGGTGTGGFAGRAGGGGNG